MKKNFVFILALLVSSVICAQEAADGTGARRQRREMSPEQMAVQRTDEIHNAVGLDSVQYQLVYIMNYSDAVAALDSMKVRRERAERMRSEGKRGRQNLTEEQRKARREIMLQRLNVRNAQMQEILSPEQYDKYLKYVDEKNKQRANNRRGRHRR